MNKIKLNEYASELANETLAEFVKSEDDEPFDGDETEYLAERFLHHLDINMGNKN